MNELTQKEGQNILIHNRYAAEHGQLFGWSMIIDQILIHNRYAAEHVVPNFVIVAAGVILIHNRYAAEHHRRG